LPIVSVQRGNISAYIPTNLISITDGQIILNTDLFNLGIKPAIDIGRSVSRVGGAAQTKAMRRVSGELRLELSQYNEVARFAKFGTEVDQATKNQIERGKRLQLILTQKAHDPFSLVEQIIVLFCAVEGYLDRIDFSDVQQFQKGLLKKMHTSHLSLLLQISREDDLSEDMINSLREIIDEFRAHWIDNEAKI
jgi:F-type H+-transporting ATPase subunit alpha